MSSTARQTVTGLVLGMCIAAASAGQSALGDDNPSWPRFHGPNGDNISTETGLLKRWPDNGPKLLWTAKGIGEGYSSVTIGQGRIYTAGDVGDHMVVFALDMDGHIQWRANNGAAWTGDTPMGSRGTPTLDGDRLYSENAYDEVVCLDARTGKKIWGVNLAQQFQGERDDFGRAESLLVDGEHLICSPGGKIAVAALDKQTGKTVWTSPSAHELASYVSPILVQCQGMRIILTMSCHSLIGVNADNGDLLWRFEHYVPKDVANCVTPIYHDGQVFVTGGYGLGSVLLRINVQGTKATVEPVWRAKELDNRHGGVILWDGYLYGASHMSSHSRWVCLDWKTGKKMYAERGVGEGAVTFADGMLYTLSEHRKVGLVKATPDGHKVVSQFTLPDGGSPTWAHPVVCGGRLYLRHGDRLYAYDIKGKD